MAEVEYVIKDSYTGPLPELVNNYEDVSFPAGGAL